MSTQMVSSSSPRNTLGVFSVCLLMCFTYFLLLQCSAAPGYIQLHYVQRLDTWQMPFLVLFVTLKTVVSSSSSAFL